MERLNIQSPGELLSVALHAAQVASGHYVDCAEQMRGYENDASAAVFDRLAAAEVEREQLDVFGKDIGIAFQIADDLLDADRDEAASILRIQGLDDAKQVAEGLLERALLGIESMCERAEPLRELARLAVRRER